MMRRLKNRFKFQLERLLLRGAHCRLLVIALAIGLVSVGAGMLVLRAGSGFSDPWEAIWWAFLRLTDPGYLGDDEGVARRTISTVVTVLGYVIFLGALIAILTQWLNQTMENLERGFTPIAQNDHVLILGWTNRTSSVVKELLMSEERVKRFLRRHGARRLRVVILVNRASAGLVQELREELGDLWNPRQVIFRSGTPLRIEHLRRVDFLSAASIILPGGDFGAGGADATDTRTIKTLLSIATHTHDVAMENFPLLVTEIFDIRKVDIAQRAYGGKIEVLASDSVISRLIAQNVRHRGLSHVFTEVLSHGDGNEVYIRHFPQFENERFQDVLEAFPNAIPLGVVRKVEDRLTPILNPPDGFALEPEDRLVFLTRGYRNAEPSRDYALRPLDRGTEPVGDPPLMSYRRVLFCGWSHKVPALLEEFDSYQNEMFQVDILSAVPSEERVERLERYDLSLKHVSVSHLDGDYTVPASLAQVNPEAYDNIVLLGSDWLSSEEESDARTITGYLLVRDLLARQRPCGPAVLVELMDQENVKLFEGRRAEVLVSPQMLSHILAQVALRQELRVVFDELFGPGGAEIFFRPAGDYGIAGRTLSFRELQKEAVRRGEIALGVHVQSGAGVSEEGIELNPGRERRFSLREEDELVVLTTY